MNKVLHHSVTFVKRNASTILTCLGGAGVVVTAVMSVKATPKAMKLIEQAEQEKGEDLTKLETVTTAGPAYIPAAAVGVASIVCIFGANVLNKRQQASLVSAYAFLDQSYKEYKSKVTELYGQEAQDNISKELAKDRYPEELEPEDGKELFYEEFSGRYFESTVEDILKAQYRLNQELSMRGCVTLNDYFEYLNIDFIDGGEYIGWSEGGNYERYWQAWIDFLNRHAVDDDGKEYYIVTMFQEPYMDFDEW